MKALTYEAKMEVLQAYLEGLSANETATKTGISKGAVVGIIKDARQGKFPELELKERIDELHRMSQKLRKGKLDLAQAESGFTFFKKLSGLGIEPDKVQEWIDFSTVISPEAPEGLIPAAMELLQIQKKTGKSYPEIAGQVRELSTLQEKLEAEVKDLEGKEKRSIELNLEIEQNQQKAAGISSDLADLESKTGVLNTLIEKKSAELGISPDELSKKLKETMSLEAELASRRTQKNKLEGEVAALTERQQKLSSQMEKASADFKNDVGLIRKMVDDLAEIAEIKGGYEEEIKEMDREREILHFLSEPDNVSDVDFRLISIVADCLDKWIDTQAFPKYRRTTLTWNDITNHVQSERQKFRKSA